MNSQPSKSNDLICEKQSTNSQHLLGKLAKFSFAFNRRSPIGIPNISKRFSIHFHWFFLTSRKKMKPKNWPRFSLRRERKFSAPSPKIYSFCHFLYPRKTEILITLPVRRNFNRDALALMLQRTRHGGKKKENQPTWDVYYGESWRGAGPGIVLSFH